MRMRRSRGWRRRRGREVNGTKVGGCEWNLELEGKLELVEKSERHGEGRGEEDWRTLANMVLSAARMVPRRVRRKPQQVK